MPDPIPAAAAPAAPAPPPPAAPVPPTPPAASAPDTSSKAMAGRLFNLLTSTPTDPTQTQPAKTAKKEPAASDPPPPAPPATGKDDKEKTPKAGDRPIKRSTSKEAAAPVAEKRPDVPTRPEPRTPAPVAPAPTPEATRQSDEAFEKDILDEERIMLDDAGDAERLMADKFRGQRTKMLAFLKENARRSAAAESGELDGKSYDESEHEKWHAANLPKISVLDARKLNQARIDEQVTKRVTPQIEEERHSRWADAETPKIKAKGDAAYVKLSSSSLPDDVMAAITERTKGVTDRAEYLKRVQDVQKDYTMEFQVAETVFKQASSDIEEFHALTTKNAATGKTLRAFDENNPQHVALVNMVGELCTEFKTTGGAALKNDRGQWFATREEMQTMSQMVENKQLAPEELKKWWTFDNEQIIERALGKVKQVVSDQVAQRRAYLDSLGYKRTIAAPVAAPTAVAPTPPGAPAAPRPATAPGSGAAPQPPSFAASLASKLTSQPVPQ